MLFALIATALAGAPTNAIPGVSAALPASTASWSAALEDAIVAAPTWAARRERLTAELGTADGDRAARVGQVLAVLASLERTGRGDPSVVRLFVRAGLSDDPGVRASAVEAAGRNGDPPLVAAAAPTAAAATAGASTPTAVPVPVASAPVPAPVAAAPAPVASTSSAPAANPGALASIPGLSAVMPTPPASTPSDGAAPSPPTAASAYPPAPTASLATIPAAAPRAAPSLATLRKYKALRLVRSGSTEVSGYVGSTPGGQVYGGVSSRSVWKVTDGGGAPLSAVDFAHYTDDRAKIAELDRRVTAGWAWCGGLGLLGAIMIGTSVADEDFGPGDAALLGGGTAALSIGVIAPVVAYQRRSRVYMAYNPAEADRRIEAYNAKLREELGVTEEDVKDIDLGTALPGPTIALGPTGFYGTF